MSEPIELISREELRKELQDKCETISCDIENEIFQNAWECQEICSCINWLSNLRLSLCCREDSTYFDKSDNGEDVPGDWFMAKTNYVLSKEVLKISSAVMNSANNACIAIKGLFNKTDKQEKKNTDD